MRALTALLVLLCSATAFADDTIREELNPPSNQAQILLNAPDRPYRVIANFQQEFRKHHSAQHDVQWLARKAKQMGADAIIPGGVEKTAGHTSVAMPVGNSFIFTQGHQRKTISAQAIKYTDH
jgi:hypothetical protein